MTLMASMSAPALARRQQRLEELCAASVRALTGDATLHYRGARLHRGARALPLFAPHLHPPLDSGDWRSFRGAADGLALRLLLSDAALHQRLAPADPLQRMLFDLLEQFRVEACWPDEWPGMARNLAHAFAQWVEAFHGAGLTESARGILFFALAVVCRSRVSGQPMADEHADLIEATRAALTGLIGHPLALLRSQRHEQQEYAQSVLAIAASMAALLRSADDEEGGGAGDAQDESGLAFGLRVDLQGDTDLGVVEVVLGASRTWAEHAGGYRVFTREYDRELRAAALAREAQLEDWRAQLKRAGAALAAHHHRLARALHRLLAVPEDDGWSDGQESGRIDARRLSQLVTSPAERRLFRQERQVPQAQACVSLLIDCSGSMRAHAAALALLADTLVRALEQAGARSEVLGFSTGAWDGGRARRDWLRAGSPAAPGRLNEAWHVVFKDDATPWRAARAGIAALLKPDLYREGLDGEAVDWACARLRQQEQVQRRVLIVISDGCPMDRATQRANDEHYLDQHLRDSVARQHRAGGVQVLGLGLGLDLSAFYPRSQALDLARGVDGAVLADVLALLAGRRRR